MAFQSQIINRDYLLAAGQGLIPNASIVNKIGRNPDIDTGTIPEDIWGGGGIYTGFPTGVAEEFQIVSSSALDTGQVTFTYLANLSGAVWQQATVTLNGTTPVNTGITGVRMHSAFYNDNSAAGFNQGTITIRHRTTVANVFCSMPIGYSQTNACAYTVPVGYNGKILTITARVSNNTAGTALGNLYVRELNKSPRLRVPFSASDSQVFVSEINGGITISGGSDIVIRVVNVSANNIEVVAGFNILVYPL